MSLDRSVVDGKRAMDRHQAQSQHVSDKLYHQNGHSKGFDQLYLNRDPFYTHPKAYYDQPRSETETSKKLKEPKSATDVFHKFSDTTSLQGIPFIRGASRWYAKVFWSIIFIGAVFAWILHSVVLIQSYTEFKTSSLVQITHEDLDFPTITFCNINPIRENTIDQWGGKQLQELLELLRPREQYMDNSDTGAGGDIGSGAGGDTGSGADGDTGSGAGGDTGSGTGGDTGSDTGSGAGSDTGSGAGGDNVGGTTGNGASGADIGADSVTESGAANGANSGAGNGTRNDTRSGAEDDAGTGARNGTRGGGGGGAGSGAGGDGTTPRTLKKRQSAAEEEDVLERDHDFQPFDGVDWTQYDDVGVFAEYREGDYSSSYLSTLLLREMMVGLPDVNRTQMGHRLADMMLGCTYDGKVCNARDFTRFLDISYGNCFSFNTRDLYDETLKSQASGASHGLDVILYIQNREYIKGIQQGRGLRLQVHPFGTQPFVEDSGISIPTGFQTYLGLRQVKQTRLSGDHWTCGDGGTYEQYYHDYLYTFDACTSTCEDRTISARCGCYRGSRKQFYNDQDLQTLRRCTSPEEVQCVADVVADYASNKFDCNCNQACKTTDYDHLLSYDQWPDDTLWHSLSEAVCVSTSKRECLEIKTIGESERSTFLAKNFIHLKIYYRDLNIETIVETQDYEDIQFYSDFGGAIGLWLGASVITLFELMDFLCRSIQYFMKRKTYQKRRELRDKYSEEKSRGSLASMHSSHSSLPQIRRVHEQSRMFRSNSDPRLYNHRRELARYH